MTDIQELHDELQVRRLIERYSDAVCQRDADAIMTLWAEDGRWSVPDMAGLENVVGKPAIKEIWIGAQALFPFAFLICVPGYISIEGDTAWARVYTTEILKDTEGKVSNAVGIYLDKFARIDGRWLFTERVWHILNA